MKNLLIPILFTLACTMGLAQPPGRGGVSYSFIDYQKTFPRPSEALKKKVDTLQKQFEEKNLQWPAKYVYIRSFKYDSQLEVWVKNDARKKFKLFKTYKVCVLAGSLGPKRMEGDYQVPMFSMRLMSSSLKSSSLIPRNTLKLVGVPSLSTINSTWT